MAMNLCVFAVTAYVGCVDRNPDGVNSIYGNIVTAYVGCVDRNCACDVKNLSVIRHSLRWLCG